MLRHRTFSVIALVALSSLTASAAYAASPADEIGKAQQRASDFDLDLFAPSAPAFIALGLSPHRMADPGAMRDFGVDVADLSNGDRYKLGVAASAEPYWWVNRDMTLNAYRNDTTAAGRLLGRMQLSFAAAYNNAKPKSFYNLGLGLQTQMLDRQDERFDAASYTCLSGAWQQLRAPAHQAAADKLADALAENPDLSEAQQQKIIDDTLALYSAKEFNSARKVCQDQAGLRSLARASIMIGAGFNTRTRTISLGGLRSDGESLWATYRQPIVSTGFVSLEAFARHSFDQTLNVDTHAPVLTPRGDETLAGAGMALEHPRWRADGSYSYVEQSFSHSALRNDHYTEAAAQLSVRIKEGLWLQASVGRTFGRNFGNDSSLGVNIKYDWSSLLP